MGRAIIDEGEAVEGKGTGPDEADGSRGLDAAELVELNELVLVVEIRENHNIEIFDEVGCYIAVVVRNLDV